MAVPKWRKTKGRRNQRRAHIFLKKPNLGKCPKCGHFVLPHTVCSNCGYYKEREVIDVLKKLTKKERKQREREMKAKEAAEKREARERPLTWEELSRR
jgi:large subunit ribosomal protein L32